MALKNKLIKKRNRFLKQLKEYDLENANKKYTYEGGRSIGLLQGRISSIEDILDLMDEHWEQIRTGEN